VARAIVQQKTRIIDIDLRSYFDNIRHDRLLAKVAKRVDDVDVLHLLKIMLKANGKQGVPQGGVISPLLSNLYLTEVAGCWSGRKRPRATASTPTSSTQDLRMVW
jgi:RNA-directed DNA polymerase